MTATFMLTIAKDTWLTLRKSQSTDLPDDQKHHVLAGESFLLSSYKMEENYYKITLDGDQIDGHSTWFVSVSDVRIDPVSFFAPSDLTPVPKPKPTPAPKPK